MMNKYIYIAAAMVPSVCMVSCSDPRESAQSAAEDYLDGLAEILHKSEGDTIEELIDDVHSHVASEMPDLLDELAELNDEERRAVLQGIVKSEALRNYIKRALQAAIAHAVDDKEIIRDFVEPNLTRLKEREPEARERERKARDKKIFDALDKHLPYETRMKAIEIGMAHIKLGYALGLDKDKAAYTIGHALMEVATEYGIPMDVMVDKFGNFGIQFEKPEPVTESREMVAPEMSVPASSSSHY